MPRKYNSEKKYKRKSPTAAKAQAIKKPVEKKKTKRITTKDSAAKARAAKKANGGPGWTSSRHLTDSAKNLSEQERFFCQKVVETFNFALSAREAGYHSYSGSQLMRRPLIQQEVQRLMNLRSERTQVAQDDVVNELALIAFSNVEDYEIDEEGVRCKEGVDPKRMRALQSVEKRIRHDSRGKKLETIVRAKFWNKDKALENLGRHLALFIDQHQLSGPGGEPIQVKAGLTQETAEFLRQKILGLNSSETENK